jgi:hypothetical protein
MLGRPLLSESWRDIIAIASAVVTVVGFVLTVISLVYAIRQIWKTQSAANAAKEAALRALAESQRNYQRYALANALRLLAEAKIYVDGETWDKAMLRLSDLAEQASQLADSDRDWKTFAKELRIWEETSKNISRKGSRFDSKKWGLFLLRLQDKIDSSHGPFKDIDQETSR